MEGQLKKIAIILVIIIISIASISCNNATNTDNNKIIVAVGIVPEATFVKQVAGDLVDVVTLIPPGNSPANYQPSAMEMGQLSDALIYFTMEMPTESANILPKVNDFNSDIKIVNLRTIVSQKYELVKNKEAINPHLWLSPKRAIVMVQTISDELQKLDPKNKEVFENNANEYIKKLEQLDDNIRKSTRDMKNKSFLIYHGSYAYFAKDYGLNMIAIEIEGKKATASEMQRVIDLAIQNNIKTVFYQEEFDDVQAKTIAAEIKGRVQKVSPLSPDYINSLMDFVIALNKQEVQ